MLYKIKYYFLSIFMVFIIGCCSSDLNASENIEARLLVRDKMIPEPSERHKNDYRKGYIIKDEFFDVSGLPPKKYKDSFIEVEYPEHKQINFKEVLEGKNDPLIKEYELLYSKEKVIHIYFYKKSAFINNIPRLGGLFPPFNCKYRQIINHNNQLYCFFISEYGYVRAVQIASKKHQVLLLGHANGMTHRELIDFALKIRLDEPFKNVKAELDTYKLSDPFMTLEKGMSIKDVQEVIGSTLGVKSKNILVHRKKFKDDWEGFHRYYIEEHTLTFKNEKLKSVERSRFEEPPPMNSFAWIYEKCRRHEVSEHENFIENEDPPYDVGPLTDSDLKLIFEQLKIIIPKASEELLDVITDEIIYHLKEQDKIIPEDIQKAIKSRRKSL